MFHCKQSRVDAPKLPTRAILCGASGEGKTHLLSRLLTEDYAGCFQAIYLWSPSVDLDPAYDSIKKYVADKLQPDHQWMFDSYEASELQGVIDEQACIVKLMKSEKRRRMYSIAIVIDDFSDSPEFTRNSKQLWSLFARGRHMFISTFVLSQRWRSLAPICRLNASVVYLHRLRNTKDQEAVGEELGGDRGKDELVWAFKTAVADQAYSFLKIDLMVPPRERWQVRMDGPYL
jgi:hypothetical protein